MRAGGSIYVDANDVEASGVLINNIHVEYRWTRPHPPQLLRPMILRQADLDAARARLLQHGALAITGASAMGIQGMPGVGKTTLAQQLALLLDPDYADGVIWQPIGPDIQTPEQVQPILNQWARDALILPAELDTVAQFEAGAVRALLAEHSRLLVVLDNVWSLEAIGPLREALPPEAHLLITTRSRNVLIALGHGYELGLLSTEDARQLVALRLGWGETVPPAQQAWCDALAQGVGFHTLALDVALGVLRREGDTPEEWCATAERLVQYLRVGRDFADLHIPEGDRELHVERVLAYSYKRMDPDAQRCFRLLGALAPDADFAAAAAGALWEQDEATAHRSLIALVNAALLICSGNGRWQQHALLRGYALALLCRMGDHEQAAAHQAAHYAAAMERAVETSEVSTMLPEQPQLRHAFAWAVGSDLALAFRLEAGAAELRALFGPAVDQLTWAEQLQAVAQQRGTAGDQARAQVVLGNALQRVAVAPGRDRPPRLAAALFAYEEALRWYQPDMAPLDYAATQNNRAIILNELAGLPGEDRRGRLEASLQAYEEALRFRTPDTAPLQYATAQSNWAIVLSELTGLAGEDRRGQLLIALSAYEKALRFRLPDTAPLQYATAQNNRAIVLSELARLPGEDRRGRLLVALSAYEEALRFRMPDTAPLDYAATQNNRAIALNELAGLTGEDRRGLLVASLQAYEEALRFRTPDTAPLDYAATQNNRSIVLNELAGLTGEDPRERLLAALSACEEALRFYTPDMVPLDYATAQNNRAVLLMQLARLSGEDRRGRLLAALQAYGEALRFYTPDTASLDYAMTQYNQANLLNELAGLPGEDRRGRLLAALSVYEEALRFRTPDAAPLQYAMTQNNRANLLNDLARLPGEDRRGRLQEALQVAWEAIGWFERLEHAPYIEAARRTFRDLRVGCGDLFAALWDELGVGPVPDWLQQQQIQAERLCSPNQATIKPQKPAS